MIFCYSDRLGVELRLLVLSVSCIFILIIVERFGSWFVRCRLECVYIIMVVLDEWVWCRLVVLVWIMCMSSGGDGLLKVFRCLR